MFVKDDSDTVDRRSALRLLGSGAVALGGLTGTASAQEAPETENAPEPTGFTQLSSGGDYEYVGVEFDDAYAIVRAATPDRRGDGARGTTIGVRVFDGGVTSEDVAYQDIPYPEVVEEWSSFGGYGGECEIVDATHAFAGGAIQFNPFWKDIGEVGVSAIIGYVIGTVYTGGVGTIASILAGVILVLAGDEFTLGVRDVDRCFGGCRLNEHRAGRSYNPNPSYGSFVDVTLQYDTRLGHISDDVVI